MILTWNLGQLLNLTRETKQRQKINDYVMLENYDVIAIFQFTASLEQSGSWILEA